MYQSGKHLILGWIKCLLSVHVITGIEDLATRMDILEQKEWDLTVSVDNNKRVFVFEWH